MRGPQILARTLTRSPAVDVPRLACWALLFDALLQSDALLQDVTTGRIMFGFDRPMIGPVEWRLAATIERRSLTRAAPLGPTFAAAADELAIDLDKGDSELLKGLPAVPCDAGDGDAAEVRVAVFSACNGPDATPARMHADLVATRHLLQRYEPHAIGVSYCVIDSSAGDDALRWLDAIADIELAGGPENARP